LLSFDIRVKDTCALLVSLFCIVLYVLFASSAMFSIFPVICYVFTGKLISNLKYFLFLTLPIEVFLTLLIFRF